MDIIPYAELDTLFLDVGNTLISINFAWVVKELATLGVYCEDRTLRRAEAAARPLVSAWLQGRTTEDQEAFSFYLRTVLSCLPGASELNTSQIKKTARELAPVLRAVGQAERLWSTVIPGVPAALDALKKCGLKLVAVSNSDGTVEEILIRQRLRAYFVAVYDSHQIGFEKPDPRIFQYAIKDSNANPARTLHVGDMYSVDVMGARAAGLHAALIDPYGDWKDFDCERIRDLGELGGKILETRKI